MEPKKYYVIYKCEDTGWYQTERTLSGVVEDEEIAKDFCNRSCFTYEEVIIGETSYIPKKK